ncbi:hypothetical protein [Pseudarthrobacter sp. MDT3-1]
MNLMYPTKFRSSGRWALYYFHLEGAGAMGPTPRAWANYKITAARWYIDTLKNIVDHAGFQRYVGVEMALDGALASLNGAFDATVAGLVGAAERYLRKDDEKLLLTPSHLINDALFVKRMSELREQNLDFNVARTAESVAAALEVGPDKNAPVGWLQQFRRLRNMPMHQDSAPRNIDVFVGSDAVTTILVAGHGREPVEYLEDVTEKIAGLTSPVLDLIEHVLPNGIPSLRPLRPLRNAP